jgi:antitoxin PrlF
MPTATLTSKGQITIPLKLRNALNLYPGTQLDFVLEHNGFRAIPVMHDTPKTLKGRFAGRGSKAVSIADMNAAVEAEAVSRHLALKRTRS